MAWTRQGMPCVRETPFVRWDIERVGEWLAERGITPIRKHTADELDELDDYLLAAVADGEATPEDARDVLTCWVGLM